MRNRVRRHLAGHSITFGHEVQPVLDRGRDAPGSASRWSASVTASSRSRSTTSCACDIGSTPRRVDGLQLVDHREDRLELGVHVGDRLRLDVDAREVGDAPDVVEREGHRGA